MTTYFNHYVKNIAAADPAAIATAKLSAADLKAIKDGFELDSEVRIATTRLLAGMQETGAVGQCCPRLVAMRPDRSCTCAHRLCTSPCSSAVTVTWRVGATTAFCVS